MSEPVLAKFDGQVFRPTAPVDLPPDTKVQLVYYPELEEVQPGEPGYFFWALSQAKLGMPPDWSADWEKYLREEDE